MRTRLAIATALLVMALSAAACGDDYGGDDNQPAETQPAETQQSAPTTTEEKKPSGGPGGY
jgi:hypothetical protein